MRFYTLRRIVWLFNALQRNLTDFFTACWLWHKPGTSPAWLYDSARGDWTHVLHSADCSPPICRDITVCIGFIVRLYIRVGIQNLCQREDKCLDRVAGTCGPAMDASAKAAGGPVTRHGTPQTWGWYHADNIRPIGHLLTDIWETMAKWGVPGRQGVVPVPPENPNHSKPLTFRPTVSPHFDPGYIP